MKSATVFAVAVAVWLARPAYTQTVRPEFEVASVKASAGDGRASVGVTPGRIAISHALLRPLIAFTYKFRESLVTGGPAWLDSAPFDIEAKTNSPAGTDPMFLMLQRLFEDRFQLKVHRETREGPVYELTIAKGGSRLKASNCVKFDRNNLPRPNPPGETPVHYCGKSRVGVDGARRTLDGEGIGMVNGDNLPLSGLTENLSEALDRMVIDKTGLTGLFDVHLEWADDAGPSIFTAVEEQLGLKLESARGPVEYLVIDRAEKPSGN